MNKFEKIFWSLPPVATVLSLAFYVFPVALSDYYSYLEAHGWLNKLFVILLIELFYLILSIWQKKISKFEKWDWTLRLIFVFPPLSFLYYIWKQEAKFNKRG
jgi:membrane protease YdiL (CAAX protease family)